MRLAEALCHPERSTYYPDGRRALAWSLTAAAILVCLGVQAAATDDPELLEQRAFQATVERVAPSVVAIETIGGQERMGRLLFGAGPTTGLVVEEDGWIISSAFNFLRRPDSILVRTPGGARAAARLVATDHNRMLVLLKIDVAKPLRVPEIAPLAQMRVGQWAIAVGRTFEMDRPNMAVGILSAKNRVWGKALQTDAAVSPNNYGGPLVDIHGRVMGVLVPLSPDSLQEVAGVEWYDSGIGFAIPAEEIIKILQRLKRGEDLYPGMMGINFGQIGLFTGEPVVVAVQPDGPAHRAGVQPGDRIVEIDGLPIARVAQLREAVSRRYAGDTLHVVVLRRKARVECKVTLAGSLPPGKPVPADSPPQPNE